jgi:hypothetical protein
MRSLDNARHARVLDAYTPGRHRSTLAHGSDRLAEQMRSDVAAEHRPLGIGFAPRAT